MNKKLMEKYERLLDEMELSWEHPMHSGDRELIENIITDAYLEGIAEGLRESIRLAENFPATTK